MMVDCIKCLRKIQRYHICNKPLLLIDHQVIKGMDQLGLERSAALKFLLVVCQYVMAVKKIMSVFRNDVYMRYTSERLVCNY